MTPTPPLSLAPAGGGSGDKEEACPRREKERGRNGRRSVDIKWRGKREWIKCTKLHNTHSHLSLHTPTPPLPFPYTLISHLPPPPLLPAPLLHTHTHTHTHTHALLTLISVMIWKSVIREASGSASAPLVFSLTPGELPAGLTSLNATVWILSSTSSSFSVPGRTCGTTKPTYM